MQKFIRLLFFIIFFSTGASALALAVLYPDLLRYYQYKQLLHSLEKSTRHLESLNARYDVLLKNIEEDPNILSRAAPAVIGAEPPDANAVYPKATAEELAAAKEALDKNPDDTPAEQPLPQYMQRLGRPLYRLTMFVCGCGLVMVAFICFGPTPRSPRETADTPPAAKDRPD